MSKEFAIRRLDVKTFALEKGILSGAETVGAHERLVAETQGRDSDAAVTWSVQGELRNAGHLQPEAWLHLRAQSGLTLICQRCLGPVQVLVSVDRSFRFVANEAEAAAEDEHSQEDVLALSADFDAMELIEDELLMELPVIPRHETCPEPGAFPLVDSHMLEDQQESRQHPFAALERLKKGKS